MVYWGVSPPADCSPASAAEGLLRFLCTPEPSALHRYFSYYYPILPATERPGGLTLGGDRHQATAHVTEVAGGSARTQLVLYRPLDAPRDEVAEGLVARLTR